MSRNSGATGKRWRRAEIIKLCARPASRARRLAGAGVAARNSYALFCVWLYVIRICRQKGQVEKSREDDPETGGGQ
jgi:hypothetical protein